METVSSEAWLDFEAFVQGAHVHEAAVEPLAAATTPVSAAASPAALLAKWPLPTILAAASHASAEEEDDHIRLVCSVLLRLLASDACSEQLYMDVDVFERVMEVLGAGAAGVHELLCTVAARYVKHFVSWHTSVEAQRQAASSRAACWAVFFGDAAITTIVGALGDEATTVGSIIANALVALCRALLAATSAPSSPAAWDAGVARTYLDRTFSTLAAYMETLDAVSDSTTIVRVLDTATQCGVLDAATFALFETYGFMGDVTDILVHGDDMLLQVSLMDVCSTLARIPAGMRRMRQNGIMNQLLRWSGVAAAWRACPTPRPHFFRVTDTEAAAADASVVAHAAGGAAAGVDATDDDDDDAAASAATATVEGDADEADVEPHPLMDAEALRCVIHIFELSCKQGSSAPLATRLWPALHYLTAAKCTDASMPEDGMVGAVQSLCRAMAVSGPSTLAQALDEARARHTKAWLELAVSSQANVRACVYASLAQVFASAPVHCRTAADDSSASGSASGSASILPSSTGVAAQCAPYIQLFDFIGTSCGQDTLDILMKALSRPLEDVRLAVYDLLAAYLLVPAAAVLRRVFGGAASAGLYLLDRSTESNKAGKDAKFAVLAAAARHPQLTLLGEYFQKELSTAFKQGPYYVPPVDPSVAVASRV